MKKILYILCVTLALVSLAGCTSRPEISEEALGGSAQILESNVEVDDAEIIVEKNKIMFYIAPLDVSSSDERLRELGVDFVKVLGGYTAGEELEAPTEEYYGELYDYYDVEIIIEGEHGAVLDKATKAKGKNEIVWQESL
ncbi:hypothetical protein [Paratissierella segnis]|jgi:hypothetical protein|uniref:Cyclophilin-like domain-containing protein n=1 Tax=Paratissierella segnis TaxID=2763679 RepID=A0A926ES52_9FIRM|nr:hypothetical protein [Paratissierella segnis]MBC8587525.1 hypothetical protein [Paratissierella segnis]